jgi:hypothetical protein
MFRYCTVLRRYVYVLADGLSLYDQYDVGHVADLVGMGVALCGTCTCGRELMRFPTTAY